MSLITLLQAEWRNTGLRYSFLRVKTRLPSQRKRLPWYQHLQRLTLEEVTVKRRMDATEIVMVLRWTWRPTFSIRTSRMSYRNIDKQGQLLVQCILAERLVFCASCKEYVKLQWPKVYGQRRSGFIKSDGLCFVVFVFHQKATLHVQNWWVSLVNKKPQKRTTLVIDWATTSPLGIFQVAVNFGFIRCFQVRSSWWSRSGILAAISDRVDVMNANVEVLMLGFVPVMLGIFG